MRTQFADLVVHNAKPPAPGSTTIWDGTPIFLGFVCELAAEAKGYRKGRDESTTTTTR
jgi:hypothetical protein